MTEEGREFNPELQVAAGQSQQLAVSLEQGQEALTESEREFLRTTRNSVLNLVKFFEAANFSASTMGWDKLQQALNHLKSWLRINTHSYSDRYKENNKTATKEQDYEEFIQSNWQVIARAYRAFYRQNPNGPEDIDAMIEQAGTDFENLIKSKESIMGLARKLSVSKINSVAKVVGISEEIITRYNQEGLKNSDEWSQDHDVLSQAISAKLPENQAGYFLDSLTPDNLVFDVPGSYKWSWRADAPDSNLRLYFEECRAEAHDKDGGTRNFRIFWVLRDMDNPHEEQGVREVFTTSKSN